MLPLYRLAWRNLGRNRRRTFFSMLALGLGVMVLLFMAAFVAGEIRGALDSAIRLQSGHLQVRAAAYSEDKTSLDFADLLAAPEALAGQAAGLPQVRAATPRLYVSGILVVGDVSPAVRVVGLDPDSPASAPFRDGLSAGDYLAADDRSGLLLGRTLADKLGLRPGDSLRLLVNTSDGSVDQQDFIVRGLYATGLPGYDGMTVILPLAKAQAIARAGDHASVIFILLKNQDDLPAVAAALRSPDYQVLDYLQLNPLLNTFEQLANVYMYVFYLIVLAITATVIINTLIMSVFERTREIGILAAMGMRGGRIMALFLAESSLIAAGGIALGVLLGGALSLYVQVNGIFIGDFGITGLLVGERIYTYLTVKDVVILSLMALVITLLAALYPARVAANLEPVEALRGGP